MIRAHFAHISGRENRIPRFARNSRFESHSTKKALAQASAFLVGMTGFEPATSWSQRNLHRFFAWFTRLFGAFESEIDAFGCSYQHCSHVVQSIDFGLKSPEKPCKSSKKSVQICLGARCRRFESCHSDHKKSPCGSFYVGMMWWEPTHEATHSNKFAITLSRGDNIQRILWTPVLCSLFAGVWFESWTLASSLFRRKLLTFRPKLALESNFRSLFLCLLRRNFWGLTIRQPSANFTVQF